MPRLPAKCCGVTGDQSSQARHQSQPSALSATPATRNEGGCHQVPRLPRETKVDVTKCHACHVKRRWVSPSATSATQSAANPVQARHQSQQPVPHVPRLPRGTKVDVAKCHARNEGGCHQVPRLPRKVPRRHRRPIQSKRHQSQPRALSATPAMRHACHAKRQRCV